MLKIKTLDDKIIISNPLGRAESFRLSRMDIFGVIKRNIEAINKEGECCFSVEKSGQNRSYLILEGNNKILLPELIAYEILSRMPLLNQNLKMPSEKIEESD